MRQSIAVSLFCFIVISTAICAQSCGKESTEVVVEEIVTTKSAQENVKSGVENFSFNVFKGVACAYQGKSFNISPLSLSMALAMVEGGAAGATADEMKSVLGFPGASQDDFAAYFCNVLNVLQTANLDVEIGIANSIWVDSGFQIVDSFKAFTERYYDAGVCSRAFGLASTADEINGWCSARTNGRISKIIDPAELGQLVLCLVNALYFKADWAKEFAGGLEDVFWCYNNGSAYANGRSPELCRVPMMRTSGSYLYLKDGGFTFVEIPYAGGSFVFDVLMPDEGCDFYGYVDTLTVQKFSSILSGASSTSISLVMPKFKMDFTSDRELIGVLESLGMKRAFGSGADFSGISNAPTSISLLRQKTFIDVNEKGTEAAAVTLIGNKNTCIGGTDVEVVVNRPFVFMIRETSTGTILFIGAKVVF